MRRTLARAAISTATIGTLVALLPHTASARTVYSENASKTNVLIQLGPHCAGVGNPPVGRACFFKDGDRIYLADIKADGHHIEVRGQVNSPGTPGFRCYDYDPAGSGWHVCDSFADEMAEGRVFAWTVVLMEGSRIIGNSETKFMSTS